MPPINVLVQKFNHAMQMLEDPSSQGNTEALDEFLKKYGGTRSYEGARSSKDNIPAQYDQLLTDSAAGERSIVSSVRWMNAY